MSKRVCCRIPLDRSAVGIWGWVIHVQNCCKIHKMKTVLLKWLQSFSRFFFFLYFSDCRLELHTGSRNWRACQALCPQIWGLKPQWSSRPCASSTSSGRWASLPLSLFFVHAQRNDFLKTIHAHALESLSLTQSEQIAQWLMLISSARIFNLFRALDVPSVLPRSLRYSYEANDPWWTQ